jgi:hypothetical protein
MDETLSRSLVVKNAVPIFPDSRKNIIGLDEYFSEWELVLS